jgi:DNA repair exonuclease SbcCD nuclease subunit
MQSPRYLIVGDIHLSDRPPASCTESYLDDLFDLLGHTVSLESDLDCVGTIWAGDVFHSPTPSRTSHRTVQRVIEIVQSYKQLWIVPGNHDLLHDRLESLLETQPLGILFRSGANLLEGPEFSGEHQIFGVPWIQNISPEAIKVRLQSLDEMSPERLVVAHAPFYPPSMELPYEFYPLDGPIGFSKFLGGTGFCYYGHVHESHGIFSVGGVTYANHGAISRGSLTESDLTRVPSVTTWSMQEGFIRHALPHKPASEVYRLVELTEAQEVQERLNTFVSSIGTATISVTSSQGLWSYIKSRELDPELQGVLKELLDNVSE